VEQPVEQVLEAQHILPVVLKGGLEGRAPATSQVVEIGLWDQVARYVLLPLEAEQPFLHRPQRAAREPVAEEAPGQVEEVQLTPLGELAGHPGHQPAGTKEGQVEGEAVVGGQPRRLAELLVEGGEKGGFVARLGQKKLDQLDPVGVRAGDGGREDLGPGPTREAGRLGVEKAEVVGLEAAQLRTGLGAVEPADRQHLGPTPGDAVGVLDRLEAVRSDAPGGIEAGRRDGGTPGKRS